MRAQASLDTMAAIAAMIAFLMVFLQLANELQHRAEFGFAKADAQVMKNGECGFELENSAKNNAKIEIDEYGIPKACSGK